MTGSGTESLLVVALCAPPVRASATSVPGALALRTQRFNALSDSCTAADIGRTVAGTRADAQHYSHLCLP